MSHVIPGSKVQITRLGEGQKTNYSVKVLKAAAMPANIDEDEEEEVAVPVLAVDEDEDDDEEDLFAK